MEPKTKTLLFIFASFLLGAAAGMAMKDTLMPRRAPFRSESEWRKTFYERLHIDGAQVSKVDSILDVQRGRMNSYRELMMSVRDTTRVEIRKLLTENQNKLYDNYIREMSERESRARQAEKK